MIETSNFTLDKGAALIHEDEDEGIKEYKKYNIKFFEPVPKDMNLAIE